MGDTQAGSPSNRVQYAMLALLTLVAIAATGSLSVSHADLFRPYLGSIPPLPAVMLVAMMGFASLGFLHSRGWFCILSRAQWLRGGVNAVMLATLFAVVIVIVDVVVGFPRSLNVPFPQSLLFYPTMAYMVEVVFHASLVTLLLFTLGKLFAKLGRDRLVWLCILIAAIPEPAIQMVLTIPGQPFSWLDVLVGLHVFVFNLVEMYLFRRYDFVSMLSFRLTYYLYWHILWGYMRLH